VKEAQLPFGNIEKSQLEGCRLLSLETILRRSKKEGRLRFKKIERSRQMKISEHTLARLIVVAFILVLTGAGNAFATESTTTTQQPQTQSIPAGEQVKKFKGIVVKREPDSFRMSETMGGPQTVVILTADTEVKSHKRGVFRGSKEYGASYILRGLRVEVDGVGNSDGQLVADKIRFDEQDLRAAQALKATVDPIETELNTKLQQQQQEQERLAGQLEENQALTAKAQASADAAAESARKAQQTADYANNRINGLDDFDPIKTVTVYFTTGSAGLGPKAKATIDEAAAWVKTQNTKGWVMAVIGYADSTGNSQRNIDLSERRANAVIYYIVSKYKMPLNRLVQPFGYGQLEPVAENKTKTGRAKNRRVEIRLMVNKGISGQVSGR
jgi:outer membrane protein OmpA-like peptidoglycan-associated protein